MARKNTPDDFHKRYKKMPSGCWDWQGAKNRKGYGQFRFVGTLYIAHRFSLAMKEPVPSGLPVLHTCDNPACVNPEHLFVGDNFINQQDCVLKGRHHKAKNVACPKGHPFSPENTRLTKLGHRCCRVCEREMCKKYYYKVRKHRRKAAALERG